jgi:hypothetical protein
MVSHLQEEGIGQHDEHCSAAKGSRNEAAEPDRCTIPYKPADGLIPKPAQSYLHRREARHTVQHMQRSPVINAQGKQLSREERLKGEEAPQRSRGSGKPRSQKEHEQIPCSSRPGARDAVSKAAQEDLEGSEKEGKDKQKAELSPECSTAPTSVPEWSAVDCTDPARQSEAPVSAAPQKSVLTPKSSEADRTGPARLARLLVPVSAQKSVLSPGGGCSRTAQYQGKQAKPISPGKRAMPEGSAGNAAQQGAAPAKRAKHDTPSGAAEQAQHARPSSAPGARDVASGPPKRHGQREAARNNEERYSQSSKKTLQPTDVVHLQSEENIRNSQDTYCMQPDSSAAPSGKLCALF